MQTADIKQLLTTQTKPLVTSLPQVKMSEEDKERERMEKVRRDQFLQLRNTLEKARKKKMKIERYLIGNQSSKIKVI